jgi:hypothetical protein
MTAISRSDGRDVARSSANVRRPQYGRHNDCMDRDVASTDRNAYEKLAQHGDRSGAVTPRDVNLTSSYARWVERSVVLRGTVSSLFDLGGNR